MSVGTIIDSIVNQLLQYDTEGTEMPVNTQNMDITVSLIKSFYKTKIISVVEDEPNPKKRIVMLNIKLPSINQKIEGIKIDPLQKNIIYADIIKYISDQMNKINTIIIKGFVPETPLMDINFLYDETNKLENNLISMCSQIKTSFSSQYELILITKIKEKISTIDQTLEKICYDETYNLLEDVLVSYILVCQVLENMVNKYDKITNKNVKVLLANKIISSYGLYAKVCAVEQKNIDASMLILCTTGKIKDTIIKDKFIVLNADKKEKSIVYKKYDDIENVLRNKIVSSYTTPINDIIKSCTTISSYSEIPTKIKNILCKIMFYNKINESIVILVWNDIVNSIVINLIKSFMECENVFSTEFISVADITIGELMDTVMTYFPRMEKGEITSYKANVFSRINAFIRFVKLCVSEKQEVKKGETKETKIQFEKDFEKIKNDFGYNNADFEEYCGGMSLFDYLKQLRDKKLTKQDPKFGPKSMGKKIVDVIKKF
jgi:hypothetical protein